MRTLAIGDVHGCLTALTTLLDCVAPAADDRLIFLGDYVDRGPDSRGVLDLLVGLYAGGRVVALRGNHDEMMTEARTSVKPDERLMWLACGGRETLRSYGIEEAEGSDLKEVPETHWRFLERDCRDWYETDAHLYVHANAYPDVPLAEQPRHMLLWEKLYQPCSHISGKVMICGHTRQRGGRPLNLGPTVCIDTAVYEPDGWLTCLEVATGRYWQADQKGRYRTDFLEEPTGVDD